ncbi:hypothetical protein BP422_15250 [Brevibacillus formosus]|uniref:Uncharacterized protein n=1 Tax=Brevibacillus formosus TaxID=54913 RepID=A0A220MIT2_9BACL|nr:hypothetical protein BP422_15250 [Brevibacillus formosus]
MDTSSFSEDKNRRGRMFISLYLKNYVVDFVFAFSAKNYSLLLMVMCGLLLWIDRKKLYGLLGK